MKRGREKVRKARLARGWSQAQLGHALGLDGSTIRKWELGHGVLHISHRVRLASVLDIPMRDLTTEQERVWVQECASLLSAAA